VHDETVTNDARVACFNVELVREGRVRESMISVREGNIGGKGALSTPWKRRGHED